MLKRITPSSARRALAAIALCSAVALPATAADNSYRGEKTLGFRAGYAGHNRSATVGLQFSYRFSRLFRLAPAVDYVIRNRDTDALSVSVDAQFLFPFSHDRMAFYLYTGPDFSSWTYHSPRSAHESGDVTTRRSRLGLVAGAGVEANISPTLRLGLSAGYLAVEHFPGFEAAFTIAYRF